VPLQHTQSSCHLSLDATQVKRFAYGYTAEGKKYRMWSVAVRLKDSYGSVDSNWVFCVLALSGTGKVTKVLEEYTGCIC